MTFPQDRKGYPSNPRTIPFIKFALLHQKADYRTSPLTPLPPSPPPHCILSNRSAIFFAETFKKVVKPKAGKKLKPLKSAKEQL